MKTLVYVEDCEGEPGQASLAVLARAAELDGDVEAFVCGAEAGALAEAVAGKGAARVYVAEHPALAAPLPQPRVDVLAQLIEERRIDTVLFAASGLTADVAGGLADRLGAGVNWDLIDLELRDGELFGKRLALLDSVLVDVGWCGLPRLALMRPGSPKAFEGTAAGAIERVPAEIQEWSLAAKLLDRIYEQSDGHSIEDAEIIVAGGRGLGGRDGFPVLEELARALDGSVAASLPVVEIGWYPQACLVGQSGKRVQPKLYVACGISGAIQHKMGMENSGTIVAINKDANAPIFDFCDLAVEGDLYEIVPELTRLVLSRRQGG